LPKNLGKGDNRIIRHGWIEDLAAIYGEAVMTVAPLRYGAGLKGKVGESLCRGVPMVGTPVAFEGYGFGDDQEIIQADCAVEIAKSILNVYSNKKVWEGLRERGRILVLETLGTQQITADLRGALDSLTALDEDS
jgi:O-antigen biosynthesis protein